jgi:hypothetical protein
MFSKVMSTNIRSRGKIKSRQHTHSVTCRVFLLLLLELSLLSAGCQDVAITWSAEAKSPDGQWLASARTQQWGGPGTAYDATTVYLKPIDDSQSATQVLVFSHQYPTMKLKMVWLNPKHLDVTYGPSDRPGDRVNLDFHAEQHSGIEISVQDLSTHAGRVAEPAGTH